MIGLAAMAVVGLMSLTVTWWASPLDQANAALFGTFDQRDLVPIGYAAFAFRRHLPVWWVRRQLA